MKKSPPKEASNTVSIVVLYDGDRAVFTSRYPAAELSHDEVARRFVEDLNTIYAIEDWPRYLPPEITSMDVWRGDECRVYHVATAPTRRVLFI